MKGKKRTFILFVLLAGFIVCPVLLGAQTNDERFGQNRVQYKDFVFQYYESDNFTTYYYQGGQDIGKYVIKTAEDITDEISKLLDFRYHRKIDIIVYNSIQELNQTNIGIYEPGQNPGGTTKIPDNKMYIYFNGDHRHVDKQIREGLARIYIDKMVMGGNFAEVVQNAVLLNLPDWYRLGLVDYIGEHWNSSMEDKLRDGILSGRYQKLNKLSPAEAIFVGHSIWHFIEETAGKTAVSNIVYLTRINRSVDNGFLFVLGTNLSQTLQNWYTYYYKRFTAEKSRTQMPSENEGVKVRIRKGVDYYQSRLHPGGRLVAYASNDMGRYKIHLHDPDTRKTKVIYRGGFRTNTQFTDQSIPLLGWEPGGKRLAFITEHRSQFFFRFYDVETGKTEVNPIRKFQKVNSFSYIDAKQVVMSAIQNGQTDIFLYNLGSTTTRKITDDFYDDLYPAYIEADSLRGIMFSSNRMDDTLRSGKYESQATEKYHDLFFYDLNANSNVLYRITSTPLANETYPQNFSPVAYCFLSEANGISSRYIGTFNHLYDHDVKTYRFYYNDNRETDSITVRMEIPMDSVFDYTATTFIDSNVQAVYKIRGVTQQASNYTLGIREQSTVPGKQQVLDLFVQAGKPKMYRHQLAVETPSTVIVTDYMQNQQRKFESTTVTQKPTKALPAPIPATKDTSTTIPGNRAYDFQSEYDFGVKLFDWDSASAQRLNAQEDGYIFRFSRVRPYFVRFSVDRIITQVDNNLIMTRYQPFDPSVPQFNLNPLSFMFKFGVTDLLENHKIYGGIRLPFIGINSNSEYFITYENLTKRLDKRFTFYRRSIGDRAYNKLPFGNTLLPSGYFVDYSIKTNYAEVSLSYPLDVLNSFRFGFAFRNDVIVYKARDRFSLQLPRISDNWAFIRAEYVFDNCLEVMTNIRYGTRFKAFAEIHKQFPTQNRQLFNRVDFPVPQFNNRFFSVIGFDLRHYQKVYKQIIWANRIAAGVSVGTAKLIYYLGGLDNWITGPNTDKFDRTTPINTNNNYAFQTLSTPLRGFLQNARNGNKYVVINSELRIPLFAAFSNSPIRSEFIRNLQLIGFVDAGTAWEGLTPFSDNNPLFNEELPNTPVNPSVVVRVKRYKTPVVMGFGPGIRTTFLGYFLRFDAAWGLDTGVVREKPLYYFTFGLDF